MSNIGDIQAGETINAFFSTSSQAGAAITMTSGTAKVYKDGSTTESTSGVTLSTDVDSEIGFHRVTITTASDGSFYAAGSTYSIVVAGTVDSQSVRSVIGTFTVQNRTSAGPRYVSQDLGQIKQSTATSIAIGPLLNPTTGEPVTSVTAGDITARFISGVTSASITLTGSGGNNDIVHIANGMYSLELTASNNATLGPFNLSLVDSNAFSPYLGSGSVVTANVYDTNHGSDKYSVDVAEVGGSAVTSSSGVLEVNAKQIDGNAASAVSLRQAMDTSNNIIKSDVLRINGDATSASNLESYTNGGANIPADVLAIDGDATAADRLELMMDGTPNFSVVTTDFTPTTTAFESSTTEATADHFNGRICLFITGNLAGQQKAITDYALTNGRGKFTVDALTEAPASTDVFMVI